MSSLKWWRRPGFRTGHLPPRKAVSSRIMALEPRFMFDAAGAVTADGGAHADMALPDMDHGAPAADAAFLDALAQSVPVAAGRPDVAPAPDGSGGHTVMFVDPTIADYQTLVDGALPGVEVVVLDPSHDGLVQMADYLNGRSGIDSIQIMAHGSAGRFALGGIDVNAGTLATHGAELAAIGRALTAAGDILIYACNTGAGIDGQAFVIDLAMATGADVAASSDNTGAAALGGNWVLETRAGAVEATAALTAAARDSYDALMTATFTLQTGSANTVSALGNVAAKIFITADFDGDGDNDFIFRNNSASPTGVTFWRNDGGDFTRFSGAVTGNPFSAITWSGPNSAVLAANFSPFSMLATDVDGDGDIDVVNMASGNARGIWLNNGGVFSYATGGPTLPTVTANTQSVAGDFDGDGDIDVILRNNTGAPTGVNFWRNDGGTFTLVSSNASNNPFSSVTFAALAASFDARFMGAGDVDGDGDIDVVNMTSANGRGVWLNNSGVFAIVSAGCLPVGTTSGQFVPGDFDGDGDTDIAFRNASGTGIDFYRASGGTFTLETSASPFSAIAFSGGGTNNNFNNDLMAAVDIDSDGDLDIANFTSTPGRGIFRNDLTPPQLTSVLVGGVTVSDADNPIGASATPTITLTFSKTIQSAGTGKIYIREYGTGTLVGTAVTATNTAKVSGVGSGSTITIDPGVTLSSGTRYYIEIDKGAFFDSDGATLGRVDRINNTTMGLTAKTLFDFTTINNTAPTLDLNGTGTGGTGNIVTLAGAASGLVDATATVGDTENDSANWDGATLTVKRTATAGTANGAWSSDQFGFTVASGITIDSGDLKSGATTIGTVTNTGGTLTVTFNTSASTALITDVVKGVTYANSAPAGNATVTVTLTDGSGGSTSADVTVTSSSINVTTTTDTATVDVTDGISFSEALAIANAQSGADTLIMGSGFTGAMNLAGNLTLSESLTVNADAADGWIIQDGTKTITLDTGTALTFTNSSGTVTVNPMLAGAGGLIKSGAGRLTLAGTNSYSAATAVSGGTLSIAAATNIGAGAITLDGGTLESTGATVSLSNDVALGTGGGTFSIDSGNALALAGTISGTGYTLTKSGSGSLALSGTSNNTGWLTSVAGGTLSVAAATNIGTGSITLDGGTLESTGATVSLSNDVALGTGGGTVSIDSGSALTLSGTISGTGYTLTKGGSGSLTLSGTSNNTGWLTSVTGGTLSVAAASNIGTAAITLDGGTLTSTGSTVSLSNSLTLGTGGGTVSVDSGNALTLSGTISGTGNTLTKSGAGTLALSGTSNNTGWLTSVTGGTLSIAAATNIGTGAITLDAGTLESTASALSLSNGIALGAGGGTVNVSGSALTLTGIISGSGAFAKSGSGALTLSGNNTYTGASSLNVGVLIVSHNNALGTTAAGTTITSGTTMRVADGVTVADALNISGTGVNAGFGALKINEGTGSATVSGNITLAADSSIGAYNAGDTLTLSGVISGSFALTKVGSGTLTLSGTNTYTGTTAVSTGTLVVTGTLNGSAAGTVTVGSGATLAGTGTVNGGVSVASGGTLSPGIAGTNDGVGTLTIASGGLTIASGGTLAADIASASSYDSVAVTGTVTVTGATLSLGGSHVATRTIGGQSFILITNDSTDAITGTFSGLTGGSTTSFNSVNLTASYAAGTDTNDFRLLGPSNDVPVLAGTFTTAGAINDSATASPFSAVTFTDADDSTGTFTVTITYTGANGTLASGGGGLTGTAGSYTLTASTPSALQTLLRALVFTPTNNQVTPGGTVGTTFTLTPNDGTSDGSSNATTVYTVTSINDTPASLALSDAAVSTWNSANMTVGTLSATDPDTGQTLTYTLVSGAGDDNNPSFNINGTALRATDPSLLTTGTYSVRVRVSDGTATVEQSFSITVDSNLYVTTGDNTDTTGTGNQNINGDYAADLADGGGLSLFEARYYTRFGGTIVFNLSSGTSVDMAGLSMDLGDSSNSVVFDTDRMSTLTISNGTLVALSGLTVTNGASDAVTISSVISGNGSVAKAGAGTLVLSGTNSYTGTTTVSAAGGTLSVAGDSNLGGGAVTLSGGTLSITGTTTIDNSFSVAAGAIISNSGAVTLSNAISGELTKAGAGTLTLSSTGNTHTATAVTAGTLNVSAAGNLNNGTGTVTLSSGATLEVTAGITLANAISGTGGTLLKSGTGTLTLTGTNSGATGVALNVTGGDVAASAAAEMVGGAITLNGGGLALSTGSFTNAITLSQAATIDGGSGNVTLSGALSGAGQLTKSNTGSLTLSGASTTYTGAIIVSTGVLVVGGDNALGTTAGGTSVSSGATLRIASGVTVADALTVSGIGLNSNGAIQIQSGTGTLSGTLTLGAAATVNIGSGATLSVGGAVSDGSNARTLTKTGAGTLSLAAASTFTGGITVSAGTLSVADDSRLGNGTLSLANGAILEVTSATTIDNAIAVTASSTATLKIDATVTISGVISGTGAGITKTGTGFLTLSGNNSYTGVTTVSAGTMLVTGALTGGGTVSVASGATLGGTGSITTSGTGVTIADGAILAPGVAGTNNGIGKLTIDGNLRLTGALAVEAGGSGGVGGTDFDQVAVTGTVSLNGGSISFSRVNSYVATNGTVFRVIDNDSTDAIGGSPGTFGSIAEGATTASNSDYYSVSYSAGTGNDVTLISAANPTVSSVSATTADGSYKAGDSIAITVTFNRSVTVTGTPTLSLGNGGTGSYSGGSGTSTLTFTYSVQAGDSAADLDYASTTALSGTIADTGGNAATLTLATPGASGSLGANKAIIIDTGVPTVSSVSSTNADGIYKAGDSIAITVAFSEAVMVTGTPTLSLGTGRTASYASGSGTGTLTFTYMVQAGDTAADLDYVSTTALSGTIADAAGNAATLTLATPGASGSLGANKDIVVDTGAPTVSAPVLSAGSDSGSSSSDGITSDTTPTLTGTAEAGSTVTLYDTDGTTLIGTGTADGLGNYSITVSTLSPGAHSITAKATDAGGNVSSASAGLSVTIDTGAPTVSSVSSTTADGTYKAGDSIAITVAFSEAVMVTGTPTLSLGTGRTASYSGGSGTSTLTFTYTVQAGDTAADLDYVSTTALSGTIADAAGNAATLTLATPGASGSLGANKDIVVDTGAPTVSAPVLSAGSDSGSSSSDGITSDTTPTLTGTAEAGSTVTLYDTDGTTLIGTGTADGLGNYSITVSTLSPGAHSITAKATDAGGNVSSASAGLSVTIDTGAPTVSSVSSTTADGAYGVGDSISITVAFSEAVTVTGTPTLSLGTGQTASYSSGSGTSTLTFTYNVQAGDSAADLDYASTTALSGTIADTAGNAATLTLAMPGGSGSLGANKDIVIDTSAPTVSAPVLSVGSDSGSSSSDGITSDTTPTLTGTAEVGSTVTLYDTDGTTLIGTGTADGSGSYSITVSALSAGPHSITAKATDAGGNVSAASTGLSVTIDTGAPTVSSVSSTTADGTYKAGDSIAITVAFSEAVVVTGTPTLSLGTGQTASYAGGSGTGTLTFTYMVQVGDSAADLDYASTTALSGTIVDTAGNAATLTLATPGTGGSLGAAKNIVIDTGAPLTPSAPVLSAGSDSGSSSSDGITSVTTPTLTGTAEAGSTVTLYDTDGMVVIGTGTADGSGSYSITVSALSAGAHSIMAKATDAGGNVSAVSNGLSVTIDTGAPTVSSVSSTNADGSYGVGDSIAITVAFSEAVTVTGTPTLSLGTGQTAIYAGGSGTGTLTFTYNVQAGDSAADLDYASTTALSGTIADSAGNAATLTLATPGAGGSLGASNDIVVDTTGPVVTSVSVPPDAIYRAGQTMNFTVTFSKMVSVDGMPVLPITLDNGEVVQAAYVSGSGGTALTFRYMVGTGRLDSNGIALAVALSGGTIRDAAGNNAALVLNGVAGTGGVHIDSVLPTVSSVTAVTADGTYTAGDTITLQVLFSETVTVSGTPSLTLNTGQTARYSGGSGTRTLTFTYDVQTGDNSADLDASGSGALSGSITDTAGNGAVLTLPTPGAANSLGGDRNIVIDTAPPAVRSVVVPPDGLYKAGETLTLLVQVSEAVTVRDGTPSILLDIGGVSRQAVFSAANSTGLVLRFDYVVQAGDSDLDGISIGALSLNGATIVDANRLALTNLANVPGTLGVRIDTLIDTPVDTVAPPAPASLALAAGSDTGSSGNDRVTNVDRPTVIGTAEPGATVTILVDGVRSATATATAGADGAWSVTLSTALANGLRTITTTATDAAGNTSPVSAALVLTVDTTAPVLTVPGLAVGSDSGASASDRITNVTRPTLTGTAEAGGMVGIILDGTMIGTTTAGADGAWSFTVGTGLADGEHSVQATSTDLAGNIARSAGQTFTIRSTAPATPPVPVLLTASDSGASAADQLTNVTRPTLMGTAIANGTVTVLIDGTAIGTVQTDASGTWSLTPGSALSIGAHQVQVRVTDVAGNSSPPSDALVLTVDTGPPTIGAGTAPSSLSAGSTVTIGAGMVLSDTNTLDRLTVTLTNAQSGDELVIGTLPGGITATRDGSRVVLAGVASAADYQAALRAIGLRSSAVDPAFGGTVSSRSITVSARDAAGNESTLATVTVPVSNAVTVPPPTTTLPPVSGNGPSTNNSSAGTSGNTSTSATGSGSSGVPSLPSGGVVDSGDTSRSVTLGSVGGSTAGNDDGRSVTLSSVGGSTASSDAGRSVTLSSVGGQSGDGFSSSSSGLSGGTGSTGAGGGISLDRTLGSTLGGDLGSTEQARPSGTGTPILGTPSVPSDQGPRRKQGSPEAGGGQDGTRPDSQSQEQNQPQSQPENQPDDTPADNPDGDQGPAEGTPDGNAPQQQGRGTGDRAAAVPAERSAPGFADQVARAHGSPVHASALLAALASHVLPANRAA